MLKSKSGFTLIEVTVVVAIIAVLATMVAVVYNNQQKSSRDSRRQADMKSLSAMLETYQQNTGNYPVTCGLPSSNVSQLRNCTNTVNFYTSNGMTAPDILPAGANFSSLKSVLPSIQDSLRDPRAEASQPQLNHFISGSVASNSYYLFSPDIIPGAGTSGTQDFRLANGSTITCRYTHTGAASPSDSQPQQYVIGTYSEADENWIFGISEAKADITALSWDSANAASSACKPVRINS